MDWRETQFVVTTYRKLAKTETGLTRLGTKKVGHLAALDWILNEIPESAVSVEEVDGKVMLTIDRLAFGRSVSK